MRILSVASQRDAGMPPRKHDVGWFVSRRTHSSYGWLISPRNRSGRKTNHSRSESAPLIRYRLSDAKENLEQRDYSRDSGPATDIKGTEEGTAGGDASPSMAPVILFPSKALSNEYKLDHHTQPVGAGDLELLQTGLPTGGCLVTVHGPTKATSWIELHATHPLMNSLHERGVGGPLPTMLTPYTEGLAIFGSPGDPGVIECAQALAELSDIPVILRPEVDNPVPKFASLSRTVEEFAGSNKVISFSNGIAESQGPGPFGSGSDNVHGSGNNSQRGQGEGNGAEGGDDRFREGNGDSGNNGGGDKGESNTPRNYTNDKGRQKEWEHLTHSVLAACKLKIDATSTYQFTIESTFRFVASTPRDDDLSDTNAIFQAMRDRADIKAFTTLEVHTSGTKLLVDATYAALGFEGHRRGSLHSCKFIPGGNEPAKKFYTQRRQDHVGTSMGVTAGYSDLMPKVEFNVNHGKGHSTSIETTTDRPAPDWIVRQQLGDRFNEETKSYISIATSYEPQADQSDAAPKPLDVDVGLRLVLRRNKPEENPEEVKISFVNRNQIHLWVSDPNSKAGARGVIFLVSNYLPNIRTDRQLMITEDEVHVDISRTGGSSQTRVSSPTEPSISVGTETNPNDDAEVFDLAVAQVHKPPTNGKLRKSPPSSLEIPSIQLQPYVTRGWNPITKCWLDPVWHSLDEAFKAVDAFSSGRDQRRVCWKLER
ncbi:hypothetical protein DFH09DRAFT_1149173 [Mycena vulgaris]|nr:hypothetical protein DFH09DRAFT_1149173 [Mycena vulgaris]